MPPTPTPDLRIEYDTLGRAVRVFVGQADITHLVARVQTNTTLGNTLHEVVLTQQHAAHEGAPRIAGASAC